MPASESKGSTAASVSTSRSPTSNFPSLPTALPTKRPTTDGGASLYPSQCLIPTGLGAIHEDSVRIQAPRATRYNISSRRPRRPSNRPDSTFRERSLSDTRDCTYRYPEPEPARFTLRRDSLYFSSSGLGSSKHSQTPDASCSVVSCHWLFLTLSSYTRFNLILPFRVCQPVLDYFCVEMRWRCVGPNISPPGLR